MDGRVVGDNYRLQMTTATGFELTLGDG